MYAVRETKERQVTVTEDVVVLTLTKGEAALLYQIAAHTGGGTGREDPIRLFLREIYENPAMSDVAAEHFGNGRHTTGAAKAPDPPAKYTIQ